MEAKITKPDGYFCAPDGHTTILLHFGQIVSGRVAQLAIADGAAEEISSVPASKAPPKVETKVEAVPEKKKRVRK